MGGTRGAAPRSAAPAPRPVPAFRMRSSAAFAALPFASRAAAPSSHFLSMSSKLAASTLSAADPTRPMAIWTFVSAFRTARDAFAALSEPAAAAAASTSWVCWRMK